MKFFLWCCGKNILIQAVSPVIEISVGVGSCGVIRKEEHNVSRAIERWQIAHPALGWCWSCLILILDYCFLETPKQ